MAYRRRYSQAGKSTSSGTHRSMLPGVGGIKSVVVEIFAAELLQFLADVLLISAARKKVCRLEHLDDLLDTYD